MAILLLLTSVAYAQTDAYLKKLAELENYANKNQWDEVVLLAPDLLIEGPERGDGYYYLAYAFFKLNKPEQAAEYLSQAETTATDNLKEKIIALKNLMQNSKQIDSLTKQALQFEKESKYEQAAEAWENAWIVHRLNLEYALNAVTNYVSAKNYPPALMILNDPAVKSDAEAVKLIERLNQTGQMKNINGYEVSYKEGLRRMSNSEFAAAFRYFETALSFMPGDKLATEQKQLALDEVNWKQAVSTNTFKSYEEYLKGSTVKKYEQSAHNSIQRGLISVGEKAAAAQNIEEMEQYLGRYLKEYPNGSDLNKAKSILCNTYNTVGDSNAKIKTASAQRQALGLYKKAQTYCTNDSQIALKIKEADKLVTRYGRKDRTYLAFVHDPLNTFGLSLGGIRTKGLGVYMTIRANELIFSALDESGETVDNSGKVTAGSSANMNNLWQFKNEKKQGSAEFLLGFTKRISYPLWIYTGGGVSYTQEFWKMDRYDGSRNFVGTEWLMNTDEAKVNPVVEAGLIVDFKGIHLRGGIVSQNFKSTSFSIGAGLSF